MGYFIVYTPSGWKVSISEGEIIVLGRSIGALKEITDNRCSRHQAEVVVTDSGLMLTCIGVNSIQVRPSEETEESYNVSQKGSTELKDGDCFALPGQLEFQVFEQGVDLDKKGVGFMEKEKKSEEKKEMKPEEKILEEKTSEEKKEKKSEKQKKAKKESEEREKLKTLREPCRYGTYCYNKDEGHRNKYSHPCKFGSECYRTSANHLKEFNHPWDTPVDPEVSDEEEEKPEVKAKDTKAKPAKNPFFVASQDDYEPPTVKKKGKGEEGPKQKKQKKAENEALEGKSFAFTGTHSVVRKQLQEIVLEHGGLFHAGVSGKTDFLVATSMECMHGTSKVVKARNAGVTIVSEQFLIDSVQNEKLMDASNYQIDEEN